MSFHTKQIRSLIFLNIATNFSELSYIFDEIDENSKKNLYRSKQIKEFFSNKVILMISNLWRKFDEIETIWCWYYYGWARVFWSVTNGRFWGWLLEYERGIALTVWGDGAHRRGNCSGAGRDIEARPTRAASTRAAR